MDITRLLLLKIVHGEHKQNNWKEHCEFYKISWRWTVLLLSTCIFSLLLHFCEHPWLRIRFLDTWCISHIYYYYYYYNLSWWTTQDALSSDHLPIVTTINIRHDYSLQQNRRTFTNYKKADWTQFTEDTESTFAQTTIPTNIHTANMIFYKHHTDGRQAQHAKGQDGM